MSDDKKVHKPKANIVKKGDILAFTYYVKIKDISADTIIVEGLNDGTPPEFSVHGQKLIESSTSADQFHEQVTVTSTKVGEILASAGINPFTVCFLKKEGDTRILRGHYLGQDGLRGYALVQDLDIKETKDRFRKVDNRTIEWLILEGVKYTVKK